MRTIDDALNRLRAEFLEMPGMQLKPEQVERLCGVERGLCQMVLDSLVDAKFLYVSASGQYARVTDGEISVIVRRGQAPMRRGIDRLSPRNPRGSDGIKRD